MIRDAGFTSVLAVLPPLLAAQADAQESRIVVSEEDCRRLVRHSPSADVEYKPGVDVRGKSIAPADLPGSASIKMPDKFEFDITLQVFERLGRDVPKGLNESQLAVARVSVDGRGNVSFNGECVGGAEEAAIADACQELMKRKRR